MLQNSPWHAFMESSCHSLRAYKTLMVFLVLQVPVPAAKLAQSEIMPARIAPQLRSAANSPSVSDAEGPPREEADGRPLRQGWLFPLVFGFRYLFLL